MRVILLCALLAWGCATARVTGPRCMALGPETQASYNHEIYITPTCDLPPGHEGPHYDNVVGVEW